MSNLRKNILRQKWG